MNDKIFSEFPRWRGPVPAGFVANFLGHLIDLNFISFIPTHREGTYCEPALPGADEEFFEWIALLESIMEAKSTFTMIELGAGFGRWIGRAACAIRRRRAELKMQLIGVEAEPTHFRYMQQHLINNKIDLACCTLVQAAVSGSSKPVHFTVGHAADWYGQAIVEPGQGFGYWPEATVVPVDSVTISQLTSSIERIDFLDMDIQGAELDCVAQSINSLKQKVRRLYVATHSPEIHRNIERILSAARWHCEASYAGESQQSTPWGPIQFQDGAQYWINPKLSYDHRQNEFAPLRYVRNIFGLK